MNSAANEPMLEVIGLEKRYRTHAGLFERRAREVRAVDGVSFTLDAHETLALVGESGSGKTTVGRALLRLVEPDRGRALYRRRGDAQPLDLFAMSARELRPLRRELQIVFQDPHASLNPRMSARETIGEVLRVHAIARARSEIEDRTCALFEQVGLAPEMLDRLPHEMSGGQRQRLTIARAIAVEPRLLVCDEAVSGLDVSLQAQIQNLFADLQEQRGLAYLFIAHDLAVVRRIADRIAVMQQGKIVEIGTSDEIFEDAAHPYTRALLSAIPRIDRSQRPAFGGAGDR